MIKHAVLAGDFLFPTGSAASTRIRNFALGLADNGVQVHILAMAPTPVPTAKSGTNKFIDGITYECLANWQTVDGRSPLRNSLVEKPGWFVKAYGTAWTAFWKLKKRIETGKCDLLLAYGRSAFQLLPLAKLSRMNHVVSLIDVVEIRDQFGGFGGKLSPIFWDWTLGEKWMPELFDGSTLITNALVPIYQKSNKERYIVIPQIGSWKQIPSVPKPVERSAFHIMYLGALLERDAPNMLFDLIKVLADREIQVQFDIVGKYHESPTGQKIYQRYSKDPDYSAYVNWFGRVTDEELEERFSDADAFILPRRNALAERASFPTRLIEYLRQAKPVFAADVGDIGFYLRNGIDAVLFPPDDTLKAANSIENILNSLERGETIGLQGWLRGAECFNYEIHAKRLLDFATHLQKGIKK